MWLFKWLGVIWAALSLIMLATHGFNLGRFVGPIQLALDNYEASMRFLFGWAEPYLKGSVVYVLGWTGRDLQLYPHWKHVFVLMWLYFGAMVRTAWVGAWSGAKATAAFGVAWGGLVALAASVAAGTAPLDDATLGACAVAGFILYRLGFAVRFAPERRLEGKSWWPEQFRAAPGTALSDAVVLIVILPFIPMLPNLVFLAMLVVALAVGQLWTGARAATELRREGKSWWQTFRHQDDARVGFLMLEAIGGAAAFILANAGLQLAGL